MVDQATNGPQRLDLSLWRTDDHVVLVTLVAPGTGAVLDPRGYTWSAPIFETREDALADSNPVSQFAVSFSGTKIALSLLRATMTSAGLAMGPYVWGLRGDHEGRRRTYLAGALRLPAA